MASKADRPKEATRREAFTASVVERWLLEVEAPAHWAQPAKIADVVGLLNSLAELSAGPPDVLSSLWTKMKRAQKAVRELRAALPDVIAFNLASAETPPILSPDSGPQFAAEAAKLCRMLEGLTDVRGAAHVGRVQGLFIGWHFAALGLFESYKVVVGRAAVTRRGPAVRFVQTALRAIGYGTVELGAIEAALKSNLCARLNKPQP